MNWRIFVGLRYFTKRRKEKFISVSSLISILGVIVGVAALIVVISIMTGFDIEIKEKIIGTYSHIVLLHEDGIKDEEAVMRTLADEPHIVATSPFIDEQAFLKHKDGFTGILVRGLDEKRESSVSNVKSYVGKGALRFDGNGIILGTELLKALRLKEGDSVHLVSPYKNEKEKFVVRDTFTSGRYDYDANMAFIEIGKAKDFFRKNSVTGIGIKVDDGFNVSAIKRSLRKKFSYPFALRSWMDLDKNLMAALAMEKKMMFMILGLIIMVACFNITSSLIMQVLEKTKDIGILRSIGATKTDVGSIFVFLGFLTGVLGVIFGGALGILIARNINAIAAFVERFTGFEFFPSDVYYLSAIPAKINPGDILFITVFSLILAVVASLYPAWKASRLNPVEAIRYE